MIIRIGYRGYGASGTLVQDPMFEQHFTNARNAGLKVGVYFFSQATTEEEAKEEAFACAYVLNGRKLDYPIYFDTEASGASNGSGRADGLGWRIAPSVPSPSARKSRHRATSLVCMPLPCGTASVSI